MITFIAGTGISCCLYLDSSKKQCDENSLKKIARTLGATGLLEAAIYITAIALSVMIFTNTLPKGLESLQGRMKLATALFSSALSLLVLPSIIAASIMIASPKTIFPDLG